MDQTPTTINNELKTKLETTQIAPNWFLTKGHINNHFCIGYGKTATESQQDAFKDYQVIINLK